MIYFDILSKFDEISVYPKLSIDTESIIVLSTYDFAIPGEASMFHLNLEGVLIISWGDFCLKHRYYITG